jgi:hypothetical protein
MSFRGRTTDYIGEAGMCNLVFFAHNSIDSIKRNLAFMIFQCKAPCASFAPFGLKALWEIN